MIDSPYVEWIIAAASGLIAGAVIAGVVVGMRLKAIFGRQLAEVASEKALVDEKLKAQTASAEELRQHLASGNEEMHRIRSQNNDLGMVRATLETQVKRIPVLEKELEEANAKHSALQLELRRESAALAKAEEKGMQLQKVEQDKALKEELLQAAQDRNAQLRADIAELRTLLDDERKQSQEKIALLHEARDQLKNEFQTLAQQILEEKTKKFTDQNRINMDHLMSPLREQIGDFRKRVEDVYDKESRDRASLQAEIHHLKELNQRISKEALNLTRALKGDSKARGNWGEVVLERVLEASGLQKGREYETQVSLKDRKGKRYQPDVIVRLPEGKDVVVDAKVSLKDYEVYFSAEDPEQKRSALKAHIDAMRLHIGSLASKSYEDLEGVRSLDFVLMFVPIEAAFLAAVEKDRELFSEAFEKNIMVVSPSTLLVTLRTIETIWRHENQNRHAVDIAKKAGALHDKFVGFVDALQQVGYQLDKAKSAYQTASDRLVTGRGNLIRKTQELKTLGVKAGKELPRNLLEMAEADDLESEDDSVDQ